MSNNDTRIQGVQDAFSRTKTPETFGTPVDEFDATLTQSISRVEHSVGSIVERVLCLEDALLGGAGDDRFSALTQVTEEIPPIVARVRTLGDLLQVLEAHLDRILGGVN